MVMTSPPYWGLRDYGVDGQIGVESTFEEYVERIAGVSSELMRVLKPTGSFYLNLGDTYMGHRSASGPVRRKSMVGLPWRIALKLMEQGWLLRNDIIWHKTNGLPSSVKDRLSNRYEHLFHFVKSERYYYNLEAIREPYKPSSFKRFGGLVAQDFTKRESKYNLLNLPPGVQFAQGKTPVPNWLKAAAQGAGEGHSSTKAEQLYRLMKGKVGHGHYRGGVYRGIRNHPVGKNPGDVWSLSASSYRGAHFAVYPERLCVKPILSSCPPWVCKGCGAPKREAVGTANAGTAFSIRVRDAQKGTLAGKWGDKFNASASEAATYEESSYRPRSRGRVITEGCSCRAGFEPGVVLDPFAGSGTTMKVALDMGRSAMGIELNADYTGLMRERVPQLAEDGITVMRESWLRSEVSHAPRPWQLAHTEPAASLFEIIVQRKLVDLDGSRKWG